MIEAVVCQGGGERPRETYYPTWIGRDKRPHEMRGEVARCPVCGNEVPAELGRLGSHQAVLPTGAGRG